MESAKKRKSTGSTLEANRGNLSPMSTSSSTSSLHSKIDHEKSVSSKTGFLTKRAMSSMDAFANWKQRFFVLADGTLSYYKQGSGLFGSSKDDLAHLKGEIQLTPDTIIHASNVDEKINCFELITPAKKLYAQADTINERQEWIDAIQSHVNIVRQKATQKLAHRTVNNYSSRSNIEQSDSFVNAATTTSITELQELIQQLMAENRKLRAELIQKDNEIIMLHQVESVSENTEDHAVAKKNKASAVLNLKDIRGKQYQLWDSAESGNLEATKALLQEAIVDVNGKGIDQWTALHFAVGNNHAPVAQVLLARGAFINARTRERLTPLHISCRNGATTCVSMLLSAGADPNLTDQGGNGCLHAAAEGGHIAIVRALLAHGIRTDVMNASGSLPVHLAPIGHPIRVLLSNTDGKSSTALELANKIQGETKDGKTGRDAESVNEAFRTKYQQQLALGPRDFEFIRVLGRGAFAKVYLVRGKGSNQNKWYALKAYNKQAIMQKKQARYIHTEKQALQQCSNHPYIVTLHYAFQTDDRLFLVMDYCGGGDLLSALTRHRSFTEEQTVFYISQIVLALAHLHSKNIVFRDLKPENIVMDVEGNCLLTDFGISKEGVNSSTSSRTFCGSPMYLAPEMISRSGHGPSLDWYSVGALTYELLTGLPPFYTNDKKQLFQNILKGHLPMPDYVSSVAKSFMMHLLQRDPKDRLGSGPRGAKEIMNHAFFAKMNWKDMYERKIPPPIKPKLNPTSAKETGIPDISNFPQAFTDQAISDHERGVISEVATRSTRSRQIMSSTNPQEDQKLFGDFDFQPSILLSPEAQEFEKLAISSTTGGVEL